MRGFGSSLDSAPSGREFILPIEPRALPWAIPLRPVGAEIEGIHSLANEEKRDL